MSGPTHVEVALERESFSLAVDVAWEERVAVLFGPSGSGKTTLFETVLGFHPDARARIQLAGEWLDDPERGLRLPTEARRLGWVPQEATLFPHLDVEGNLRFGAGRADGDAERALARAVEVLEIGPLLGRAVDGLSGGERQRVAIARALASGPRALLLDEPLASLDLPLRARVLPYLLRIRDELDLPILYITHDPDEALLVGDVVVVLDGGRVVASGPPAEVLWSRAVLPLSEALGIENVFDGRATADDGDGCAIETAAGLRLVLPAAVPAGESVRVGVRAEDVLVAVDEPGRISARNVLRGEVRACSERDDHVLVELDVGERLVARLTPAAVASLEIAPGRTLYALIKAQALRRVG